MTALILHDSLPLFLILFNYFGMFPLFPGMRKQASERTYCFQGEKSVNFAGGAMSQESLIHFIYSSSHLKRFYVTRYFIVIVHLSIVG